MSAIVFLTEKSTSPVSVDAPGYEQSFCTNVAFEFDFELSDDLGSVNAKSNFEPSVCPMLINEPVYEFSACPVSVSVPVDVLFAHPVSVS